MADSAYARLPLNALRVFEAVATRLSFGDAAEALHVTAAAVSQQIRTLEDYLGTPLFRRSGRRVELTPEGEQLLPRVRRGLDELEAALNGLRTQRHAGTLNLSLLSSFLQKWLMPRLGRLQERHPEVALRLHTSRDSVDFARTDHHAAIRFGVGPYAGLESVHVLDEWLVPVAAPRLLARHGMLVRGADLSRFPVLHGRDEGWSHWIEGGVEPMVPGPSIDDSVGVLTAAESGLGYALVRWTLAADDVAAGRLAIAGDVAVPFGLRYWLVCPPSYAALPKLVAFREWLLAEGRAFAPPPLPIVDRGGLAAARRG